MRRFDLAEAALTKYLTKKPDETRIWIELAIVQMTRNRITPTLNSIEKAVEQGGDSIRSALLKDARFQPLYKNERFKKLVPPMAPKKSIPFNNIF